MLHSGSLSGEKNCDHLVKGPDCRRFFELTASFLPLSRIVNRRESQSPTKDLQLFSSRSFYIFLLGVGLPCIGQIFLVRLRPLILWVYYYQILKLIYDCIQSQMNAWISFWTQTNKTLILQWKTHRKVQKPPPFLTNRAGQWEEYQTIKPSMQEVTNSNVKEYWRFGEWANGLSVISITQLQYLSGGLVSRSCREPCKY